MARKRRDRIEEAISEALYSSPEDYIDYDRAWHFVRGLEAAKERIDALIEDGQAARAVGLYETLIDGSCGRFEDVDDSGGSFGMFMGDLFCGWITARQAAAADPGKTVEILLSWVDEDRVGYCHKLEENAVNVLNKAGLVALERAERRRLPREEAGSYRYRRAIDTLKAIYTKRLDADAYAAVCEEAGEVSPRDCEVLAEIQLKRRRPEDALTWVDRGLKREKKKNWGNRFGHGLDDLRREILKRLGRTDDAVSSAWKAYEKAPSDYAYEELMRYVPKGKRSRWNSRAIAALDGAGLSTTIRVLVKAKEWKRLADVVGRAQREKLMALSHYTTEPAAKGLAKTQPLAAAKLHVALGLRIVEAKKSRFYAEALTNFEEARDLLLKKGRGSEWKAIVAEIREKHSRKRTFMPCFERLAAEGRGQNGRRRKKGRGNV